MNCIKSLKIVRTAIALGSITTASLAGLSWQSSASAVTLSSATEPTYPSSPYQSAQYSPAPTPAPIAFGGTSSGAWTLPTGATPSTLLSNQDGGTNNRLEWGTTYDPVNCPTCTPFNNYVQYDGSRFSTPVNALFRVGQLSYRNGSTKDTFDGDFGLNVSLLFASPVPQTQTFSFLFNILNTNNTTGDPVLDGDILRFSNSGVTSQTFAFGGQDYTLQLVGFSKDAQGRNLVGGFNSPEGQTDFADLFARIVPVQGDGGSNGEGEGHTCKW